MILRPYQEQAVYAITSNYNKGINRQVAVLATGLGKTIIFSHLISRRVRQTQKKALIIAHREELLLQAKDKLLNVNQTLQVGIEQAEQIADHTNDEVVIASIASIGRSDTSRLQNFNPKEYSTIIIDEAHHASAETYKNVLRYFGVLKNDSDWNREILLLGVTATPKRNDNNGIEEIFDEVTFDFNIVDGIKQGWLSRIRAFKVDTTENIDSVGTMSGDFNIGELEEKINTPERNALIVKTYKDLAYGKRTLVFAVDVAHTKSLYESFKNAGIHAAYVTGETPHDKRKETLQAFAMGQLNVLVNALVLTEGYDNAGIENIFLARPTKSGILYQQMIGRGTRVYEGKKYLTIVDFVDNTTKHSLQTAASLVGLDGTVNFRGQDILLARESIDKLLDKRPHYNLNKLDMDRLQYVMEEVDLLQEQEKVKQTEHYSWHSFGDAMRIHNGKHRDFLVEQSLTGQYILTEHLLLAKSKKKIGEFTSKSEAMRYADSLLLQSYSTASLPGSRFGSTNTYGGDMPSEAQIALLRDLGADEQTILFLDKSTASLLINDLKRSKRIS
jgi:ATP-dependent helicase IRC3